MNSNKDIKHSTFERKEKRNPSVLLWTSHGQAQVENPSMIFERFEEDSTTTFTPPDFGVTVLGCV